LLVLESTGSCGSIWAGFVGRDEWLVCARAQLLLLLGGGSGGGGGGGGAGAGAGAGAGGVCACVWGGNSGTIGIVVSFVVYGRGCRWMLSTVGASQVDGMNDIIQAPRRRQSKLGDHN